MLDSIEIIKLTHAYTALLHEYKTRIVKNTNLLESIRLGSVTRPSLLGLQLSLRRCRKSAGDKLVSIKELYITLLGECAIRSHEYCDAIMGEIQTSTAREEAEDKLLTVLRDTSLVLREYTELNKTICETITEIMYGKEEPSNN